MGFGLGDRDHPVQFPGISYSESWATLPPIQCVSVSLSVWIKRLERDGDNSFPPIAEVKNNWSYIPTPPCAFMA